LDKRLLQALLLSFLVLLGWQLLFAPKPPPRTTRPGAATDPAVAAVASEGAAPGSTAAKEAQAQADAGASAERGPKIGESDPRTLELTIGAAPARGSYRAVFSNRGATLVRLQLGDSVDRAGLDASARLDPAHWTTLLDPPGGATAGDVSGASLAWTADVSAKEFESADLGQALWRMRELSAAEGGPGVEFDLATGSGVRYVKRVRFVPDTYRIELELSLENLALDRSQAAAFRFTPAAVMPREAGDSFYVEPQAVAAGRAGRAGKREELSPPEIEFVPPGGGAPASGGFEDVPSALLSFAGMHNKYFAVLLRAGDLAAQASLRDASWRSLPDGERPDRAHKQLATDVHLELALPARGESKTWRYALYAGPKQPSALIGEFGDHEALLKKDLGFFDGIASLLLAVLRFFQGLVGNWGVAIILLTISVRLILFPVNRRAQTAMARYQTKMKRLQPQIEELKRRLEKDPAKLRQEQGLLMQREGAFPPLFGCLTMLVQIPVFFGLFSALRTSFDLRQAPFFGWMVDLAKPDRLMDLGLDASLPLLGSVRYLNVLPPLMVVLWILQQALMPKPADPQALRMHKMMMFMPAVMGLFLYNYAAGLSLYMITQSALGIAEQTFIKKHWPVDDTEQKPHKGFMAKLMERAEAAQRQQRARASKPRRKY
jgi:YidC/Oxa1 family membrane protein insertase